MAKIQDQRPIKLRRRLFIPLTISFFFHLVLFVALRNGLYAPDQRPEAEKLLYIELSPTESKSKGQFNEKADGKHKNAQDSLEKLAHQANEHLSILQKLTKQILTSHRAEQNLKLNLGKGGQSGQGQAIFNGMSFEESAELDPDLFKIYERINALLSYHRQLADKEFSGYVHVEFTVDSQGVLTRFHNSVAQNSLLEGYVLHVLYRSLKLPINGLSKKFSGSTLLSNFHFEVLRSNNIAGNTPKFEVLKNAMNFYRSTEKSLFAVTLEERVKDPENNDPAATDKMLMFDLNRFFEGTIVSRPEPLKNRIEWDLLYRKRQVESRCRFHNLPQACYEGGKLAKLFGEFEKAHHFFKLACSKQYLDSCQKI